MTAGAVVGGGAGATSMRNDKGVVINLTGVGQGIDFRLAVSRYGCDARQVGAASAAIPRAGQNIPLLSLGAQASRLLPERAGSPRS